MPGRLQVVAYKCGDYVSPLGRPPYNLTGTNGNLRPFLRFGSRCQNVTVIRLMKGNPCHDCSFITAYKSTVCSPI
jgi:hypothetical protein